MKKKSKLEKLGQNIANQRHKNGLSQDALAHIAKIGERTVSRIESGETDPRFTTLQKIAENKAFDLKGLMKFED
jgi:transcriptional regulator with XRE-family HTH domain